MSLPDELQKLAELHERGVLSSDEFQRAKARLLNGAPLGHEPLSQIARLRRSRQDRWIGGVCGGLARTLGVESWVCRLCFALLFLMWGAGLLLYVLLWIFVPEE
jgi:phage shock protein PspC (stress-responsive transcriptional regulator)